MVDALSKKFVDPLEFIRDYHKGLLYDLRCLQVNVITLDFKVLVLNIIAQPNLLGKLRPYKE